jgi:antitoxin (DNA-binding transcriptional repressor) of toxin-antitoxin stability system
LVEGVLKGDEVIISKAGKPVAKLVPYDLVSSPRQLGVGKWHGKIWMADDFDYLPEDVVQLFTVEADEDESIAWYPCFPMGG